MPQPQLDTEVSVKFLKSPVRTIEVEEPQTSQRKHLLLGTVPSRFASRHGA